MIIAKNDTAREYLGIHPNLDLALERINEDFFATLGSERVEVSSPKALTVFRSEPQNDFWGYQGEGRVKLILSPGEFLCVWPDDAHKIKMMVDHPETVTKAVFKIKIK